MERARSKPGGASTHELSALAPVQPPGHQRRNNSSNAAQALFADALVDDMQRKSHLPKRQYRTMPDLHIMNEFKVYLLHSSTIIMAIGAVCMRVKWWPSNAAQALCADAVMDVVQCQRHLLNCQHRTMPDLRSSLWFGGTCS